MPIYAITGANAHTGRDITLTIDAPSVREAQEQAASAGIMISGIEERAARHAAHAAQVGPGPRELDGASAKSGRSTAQGVFYGGFLLVIVLLTIWYILGQLSAHWAYMRSINGH